MATQKNNGGWRGNRPAPQNTPDAAPATPGWKQSSARTTTAKSGFSPRRKLTLIFALLITTVLAWFLALIFLPPDKLETFVINPGTPPNLTSAVHIHAANPPAVAAGNNDLNPVEILEGKPTNELGKILAALNSRTSYRKPAAAVIINLQVVAVPDRSSEPQTGQTDEETTARFFLLPRQITSTELQGLHENGTPPAGAVSPEELKSSIQKLLASVPNANVLLLLDQPAPMLSPLHGLVQLDVVKTIFNWTSQPELSRLAFIAAADDQHYSLPDPKNSTGKTAFAARCETVLTNSGHWKKSNKDQIAGLSAEGFRDSVKDAVPTVQHAGNFKFELLREPLKSLTSDTAPTVENVLAELKQCCDKLPPSNPNSPSTWQPVQTQTLHHTLHNTQLALLARNTRLAREFLKVFDQEFQKFPSQASFTPPAARSDADTPDNTPEKILANALATRGNLVPSIAELTESRDAIVNNRRLAELAAATAFASADLLQPLLLPREEQQLLEEDRFLANAQAPSPEALNRHQQLLEAAAKFADTRSRAHSFLSELAPQLPHLVEYCRLTHPDSTGSDSTGKLMEILSQSLRCRDSERDQLNKLRRQAVADSTDDFHPHAAALLIVTRLLRIQLLDPLPPPATELTPNSTSAAITELNTRASELQSLLDDATAEKTEIDRTLDELATAAINNSLKAGGQLNQLPESARHCHMLLQLPLSPVQRGKIIESLARIETAIAKASQGTPKTPVPDNATSNGAAPQTPTTPPPPRPVSRSDLPWLLQLTRLLPSRSDNLNSALSQLPDQPGKIDAGTLHKIASSLQAEWASTEQQQLRSLEQLDTTHALRVADIRVRLLPPAIAQHSQTILPLKPKPEISSRFWQQLVNDYRDLQIERLRLSRWVLPSDQPPLATNGWYAREIRRWQADSQTNSLSLEPALEIEAAMPEVRFANDPNPTLEVPIRISNPAGLSGIAALQLLPPEQPDDNAQSIRLPPPETVSLNASGGRQKLPFRPQIQGGTARPAPCSASDFKSATFFRGRTTPLRAITINPCEAREWIVNRAAHPTNSSVEVTSTNLSPVAFVLDWSSSMKETDGGSTPRSEKAAEASRALIDDHIKSGFINARQVSLRVFGHRVGYASGNNEKPLPNPDYESAFNGFQFPQGEANQDETQGLISMTFINDSMRTRFIDVIERLRQVKPWGWSPLYGSIGLAVAKDLGNQSGVVVAVTDGIPGDGPNDPVRNQLPALLRRLNSLNGRVQIMILCMVPEETERIQKQLEESLLIPDLDDKSRQLLRKSFLIGTAENTEKITAEINLATKPAPLELRNSDSPPASIEGQINPEGSGALVLYKSDRLDPTQTCKISLGAQRSDTAPLTAEFTPLLGGHVLLEADWKNKYLKFKHEVSTELSVPVQRPPQTSGTPPIRLVVAEPPQRRNQGQLAEVQFQLLLDHDDYTKPVPLPAEVEFCYSAPTGFPSTARIEETFQSHKGCPAWKINVTGWNPDGRLRVQAFWKMNRSTPDEQISLTDALQLNSPSLARQLEPANIPKLRLWSFITENQTLQVRIDPAPPYQPPTPGSHQRDPNSLHSVHIALVEKDAANQLQPLPCAVTIRRLENGSSVYEFRTPSNPPWTSPGKDRLQITLTSLKTRLQNALTTTTDLRLD